MTRREADPVCLPLKTAELLHALFAERLELIGDGDESRVLRGALTARRVSDLTLLDDSDPLKAETLRRLHYRPPGYSSMSSSRQARKNIISRRRSVRSRLGIILATVSSVPAGHTRRKSLTAVRSPMSAPARSFSRFCFMAARSVSASASMKRVPRRVSDA